MGAFEHAGDAEEEMLVGASADKLEADGQAIRSKAARKTESGDAGEIGGPIVAEQKCAGGMVGAIQRDSFGADEGCGDRSCRRDDGVEGVVHNREMELLNEFVAKFERFQVGSR